MEKIVQPYCIWFDYSSLVDGDQTTEDLLIWCSENLLQCYQFLEWSNGCLIGKGNLANEYLPNTTVLVMFEDAKDAALFKLRWVNV